MRIYLPTPWLSIASETATLLPMPDPPVLHPSASRREIAQTAASPAIPRGEHKLISSMRTPQTVRTPEDPRNPQCGQPRLGQHCIETAVS